MIEVEAASGDEVGDGRELEVHSHFFHSFYFTDIYVFYSTTFFLPPLPLPLPQTMVMMMTATNTLDNCHHGD
jgi:hypothetical protein